MLAVLVLLGFVYYTMFLKFHIRYFPNGPQNAGEFMVAADLVRESGTRMTDEVKKRLTQMLPKLYAEADAYVAEFAYTKQYGLTTFEEYTGFYQNAVENVAGGQAADLNAMYADAMRLSAYLTSEETGNIEGRIHGAKSILERYDAAAAEETEPDYLPGEDGEPGREYFHGQETFYGADEAWRPVSFPGERGVFSVQDVFFSVCRVLLAKLDVRDLVRGAGAAGASGQHRPGGGSGGDFPGGCCFVRGSG